ncbi:pseudouridine synthase [Acidovorax sp.]|uniref:pseudouridine synthase n=1 Tax=Acidovorax sp. TaxID=1872122 RepID=UPI00391AB993
MSSSSSRPPSAPPPPDAAGGPARPVLRRPTLSVAPKGAPARPATAPAARPPRPSRAPAPSTYRTASGGPFVAPVRQVPAKSATPPGTLPTSRLNKRMAELGLCSRREADDWIAQGWVKVNGQVAEMGVQVLPTDRIEVDPVAQGFQEQRVTILLHKPMGYVSGQAEDGHTPAVALINPRTHWRDDPSRQRFSPPQLRGLAPAGRLDIDSVGLLVLTQDGRVARQLIGEDSTVDKEYLVRVQYGDVALNVQQVFPADQLARLCHGLSLDGQPLKPARVEWQNPEQLRFVLTEGKKRQIRRMCELVGLKVVGLKRIRMGRVTLGSLPVGQWRYLLPTERF